jgi:hypothetical protein
MTEGERKAKKETESCKNVKNLRYKERWRGIKDTLRQTSNIKKEIP